MKQLRKLVLRSAAIPTSHRPSHCSLPVPFYCHIAPSQALCMECLSWVINTLRVEGPGIWCWILGECFPTFRVISLPSSWTVISLLRGLVTFEGEGEKGFETSVSFHPTIQCHLPATSLWGPQISCHYQFLRILSLNKKIRKSDVWLTVHRNSVWIRKPN